MKFLIVFVAIFAVALANYETEVEHASSDVQPESFSYSLKLKDGTALDQAGHLEHAGSEHEAISVKGSYSYVDPDGHQHTVNYIADENGYQPTGADIPVA